MLQIQRKDHRPTFYSYGCVNAAINANQTISKKYTFHPHTAQQLNSYWRTPLQRQRTSKSENILTPIRIAIESADQKINRKEWTRNQRESPLILTRLCLDDPDGKITYYNAPFVNGIVWNRKCILTVCENEKKHVNLGCIDEMHMKK